MGFSFLGLLWMDDGAALTVTNVHFVTQSRHRTTAWRSALADIPVLGCSGATWPAAGADGAGRSQPRDVSLVSGLQVVQHAPSSRRLDAYSAVHPPFRKKARRLRPHERGIRLNRSHETSLLTLLRAGAKFALQ